MKHFKRYEDAVPEVMNNGITRRILSYDDSLLIEELVFDEGALVAAFSSVRKDYL